MAGRAWRRTLALSAVVALLAAGCAEDTEGGGDGGSGQASGPIKIGAVLDLTGAGKSLADPEKVALEYLTKQVNDDGGIKGRKIELIVRDNGSDDARSRQIANELINQDKVDIILGATRTATSLPIADLADQRKVPMISLAAGISIIQTKDKKMRPYVFKSAQNDSVVVEKMVANMVAKGYKTMALYKDATAYGAATPALFREIGAAKGVKVVATEEFDPRGQTEYNSSLLRLKNARADVLVIWGIPPSAGTIQAAVKNLAITTPVMQSHGIGNKAFFDAAGAAANGMQAALGRIVVADQLPDSDPQKKTVQTFVADYKAASGGDAPSTFAGHAYDAFQLAVQAFEKVGTDKEKVRDALEEAELAGVSGQFKMSPDDHAGLGPDALVIVTAQDGAWRLEAEQPE